MTKVARNPKVSRNSRDLECWASRYRLQDRVLEILRQGDSLMTEAEAVRQAKGEGY